MNIDEKLEHFSFFDGAILSHGFTPYLRDYEIVAEASGAYNVEGSGRYRYLFTHCVQAVCTTRVRDDIWRISWDDV